MLIHSLKSSKLFGAILLITGSCVGAGMLALPVITGLGGFIPSTVLFILAWAFMTTTAMLLLEANLAVGHHLSLISIAEKTLGSVGKILCWILFLFLFYSLGIAYIAASGGIVHGIVDDLFGVKIPNEIGSIAFTLLFGIVIYFGTRPVDYLNRVLMAGLIVAYLLLIILGLGHVKLPLLAVQQWKYAYLAFPVLVISFGFHNMIPTLVEYLDGDIKRLRTAVFLGSCLPLIIYLLFELVMLGIIPIEGRGGLSQALDKGEAATCVLRTTIGKSWVSSIADSFALFAIVTSFLTQSLSLVDFLSDGLKITKVGFRRVFLILLTLIPSFVIALLYPGIFIRALNLAGAFSAVVLFGIFPALMCWMLRYKNKQKHKVIVPLGRPLLIVVLLVASMVFIVQLLSEIGL